MKKIVLWVLLLLMIAADALAETAGVARPPETASGAAVIEQATELRLDSRGAQVSALQKRLYMLGFFTSSVDGIYGNNTYLAVKEFEEYARALEQRDIDAMIAAITPSPAPTATPEPDPTPEPRLGEEGVTAVEEIEATSASTPAPTPVPTPVPTPATRVDGTADMPLQELIFGDADALYLEDVAKGSGGLAARRVQRRLVVLNYLNDTADGLFGVNSETALAAFQVMNGLPETGVADRETQRIIFSDKAKPGKKPVYNQLVLGSSGEIVKQVQRQLITLGFMNGSASGYFDKATQNGVIALEKYLYVVDHPDLAPKTTSAPNQAAEEIVDGASASEAVAADDPENNPYEVLPEALSGADAAGFVASGVMSDALQRRFLEDGIPVYSDALRKGDSGDDVVRVQRRLHSLGYLTASGVDGLFGGGTEAAVKHFQSRNKMEQTGIADQTMQYTLFSSDAVKSIKPYQIKVSIKDQRVYVYSADTMDNYTILTMTFKCSTGLDSTPTPKGTFTDTGRGARWHYFQKFDCWAQYAWYIDGDIMFHSVLYSQQDESTLRKSSVNALGYKASHGCVRLAVSDAKWIWDNCSSGTTVVVY
ncbi:MAG: peptidoglycan-binding protein [Clostridia bacterium]|nr:peptidoglycan-binding protein [Clostridia bacterium]